MSNTYFKCDRCGRFYNTDVTDRLSMSFERYDSVLFQKKDFCPDCRITFISFIKEGRDKGTVKP
jgi:hypothetical protein